MRENLPKTLDDRVWWYMKMKHESYRENKRDNIILTFQTCGLIGGRLK